jgi:hypothetical protein
VKRLEKWQDDCKLEKERNAFEEKLKYEIKLHETKLKLESEHQAENGSSSKEIHAKQVEAKLPKLVNLTEITWIGNGFGVNSPNRLKNLV